MTIKKIFLVLAPLLFVAVGAFIWHAELAIAPSVEKENDHLYSNETYGIAFRYPDGYVLDEKERGDSHRKHYTIVLIRKEDAAPRVNSEGPTAITLDIYQNILDKETLLAWLKGNNASNFKLSDGTYASTTVNGVPAVYYHWSGLYEGETTAFLHKDNIVAVSVTSITPQDANRSVYTELLRSFELK